MLPRMNVNQKAIAERLGVSLSTVSRALRNGPSMSDRTRARIMETAASVGYRLPSNSRVAVERDAILDPGGQPWLMVEGKLCGAILVYPWPEDVK